MAQFLTCPIFTGCLSEHRRWKRGRLIIRDATYWAPLIVLTLGSRIEEILLLKRADVRFRNGTYCLAIGSGPEAPGKTEDSKRVVPIPQLLLDLGFVEWFQALPESHGVLLFPEATRRTTTGDVTSAFGKHLRRILDRLGLGDFDEDFYALRKTFLSMLRQAKVNDGQRQAIAGHKHGSILNIHYTAHNTRDLKAAVDKADFKLEIGRIPRFGFPVIKRCDLAAREKLDVEVTINDAGAAASIRILSPGAAMPVFEFVERESTSMEERITVGNNLKKIFADRSINLPKNPSKRAALEYLQALA
ncbi:tyrosine-type recombinase/integrase [Cribrihabitans sp. XS_ASV171]